MIRVVDLEREFTRELLEYERRVQRVLVKNGFGSSDDRRNSFVLVIADEKDSGCLWVAKVVVLFKMIVRGSNESKEYSDLQYIIGLRLIDRLYKTLWCICLRWTTDDEMDHSLERGTSISKQASYSVG